MNPFRKIREVINKINKRSRTKKFKEEERHIERAMGMVVKQFEPLVVEIMRRSLDVYNTTKDQNFSTKQAQHDIERIFELEIKRFINSKN